MHGYNASEEQGPKPAFGVGCCRCLAIVSGETERSLTMIGSFKVWVAVVAVCGVLALPGCKDEEKEKAIADAKAAKQSLADAQTQMAGLKTELTAAQKERDDLKGNVGNLTTSLTGVKTELTSLTATKDQLQKTVDTIPAMKDQLTQLAKDKADALVKATNAEALVADLKTQLKTITDKVASLEAEKAKLLASIDDLKKKVSSISIPGLTSQQN
jgi:chromosome segregation ATPase